MEKLLTSQQFYDCFAADFDAYAERKKDYLSEIDKMVVAEIPSAAKVLDIGSGTGKRIKSISALANAGVHSMDNSQAMISILRSNGVEATNEDITDSGFNAGSRKYDVVLCLWNVLGHIPQEKISTALQNMRGLLYENGKLIFDVNNRHNVAAYGWRAWRNYILDLFGFLKGDYLFKIPNDVATTVHIFTPEEINKILADNGFKIVKKQFVNYSTGNIENSFRKGQIFIVAQKQ